MVVLVAGGGGGITTVKLVVVVLWCYIQVEHLPSTANGFGGAGGISIRWW